MEKINNINIDENNKLENQETDVEIDINKTAELARKLAVLGQIQEAINAYTLLIHQNENKDPNLDGEAALYIFNNKGNYKLAYSTFITLYNNGHFQNDILDILITSFYSPNAAKIQKRYNKNVKNLKAYKYIFNTEFLDFDNLKIKFFPFDENGYIPFYPDENRFGEYINIKKEVIDRYFFKDLENPILADDVYSQYQLEYLYDNVRRSEWVAKDNHIYLHYTDFEIFCSYLQILNFGTMLAYQKFVFLFQNEISMYPIDFKEKYNIDYSEFSVKPIGVSEINKIIWHTQLASHNGGDFFNEILDAHPNLMVRHSIMLFNDLNSIEEINKLLKNIQTQNVFYTLLNNKYALNPYLQYINKPTKKDIFIAVNLAVMQAHNLINHNSRIAPAILFQPHFGNIDYMFSADNNHNILPQSQQYEELKNSGILQMFKYVKTFTPMRRITTSYGAANRFMYNLAEESKEIVYGDLHLRIKNRSFFVDKNDRNYSDSILVRFEDGKLNPTATFTALAEFLDIPYTESMKNCSFYGEINAKSMFDNVIGFDTSPVYKEYKEFAFDHEKLLLEYSFRDIYKTYGYDFLFYNKELSEDELNELINKERKFNEYTKKIIYNNIKEKDVEKKYLTINTDEQLSKIESLEERVDNLFNKDIKVINNQILQSILLLKNPRFVNKDHQPLIPMKLLKLDESLLENPLYR